MKHLIDIIPLIEKECVKISYLLEDGIPTKRIIEQHYERYHNFYQYISDIQKVCGANSKSCQTVNTWKETLDKILYLQMERAMPEINMVFSYKPKEVTNDISY